MKLFLKIISILLFCTTSFGEGIQTEGLKDSIKKDILIRILDESEYRKLTKKEKRTFLEMSLDVLDVSLEVLENLKVDLFANSTDLQVKLGLTYRIDKDDVRLDNKSKRPSLERLRKVQDEQGLQYKD